MDRARYARGTYLDLGLGLLSAADVIARAGALRERAETRLELRNAESARPGNCSATGERRGKFFQNEFPISFTDRASSTGQGILLIHP